MPWLLLGLKKKTVFVCEVKHKSGENSGHADFMSRLPATATTRNITTIMNFDLSSGGQPNISSQNIAIFKWSIYTSNTIKLNNKATDTDKICQTDNEHSDVNNGTKTVTIKNIQTEAK